MYDGNSYYNREFDNRSFWDNRYSTNSKLGSGIGSRGEYAFYKKTLLMNIIHGIDVKSVLDVGCGDLEIIKDLPLKDFTGIDISRTIIEKNRRLRPDWRFIEGDFLKLHESLELFGDLVICFDVLIHQQNLLAYNQFVKCLFQSTLRVGIVSGFEDKPRAEFTSEITFYHEPLTRTLEKVGVRDMSIIGRYRDLVAILYKKVD